MNILITGVAGFIGFSLAQKLSKDRKFNIVGIDNINNYYDINLKKDRLKELKNKIIFYKIDICNKKKIEKLFHKYKFTFVIHLAAQAGVRFSITNPKAYIDSNIYGFYNIIETCKNNNVKKFIYASSSSIYGDSKIFPLSESMTSKKTTSLYASTKKFNEMIAENYFLNYKFGSIGLRFFTVYGPYGRPDMAIYKFSDSISRKKKLELYNYGNHFRDFTYIDDVIDLIVKIIKSKKTTKNHKIYNIGFGRSVNIKKIVKIIEKYLEISPKINFIKRQKGDVLKTYANISKIKKDYNFIPKTQIEEGLKIYLKWFNNYYKK